MKRVFVLLFLLLSLVALAQIPEPQPTSPAPAVNPLPSAPPPLQLPSGTEPIKTLPPWAYILGIGGWNSGLLALKHFGPRVPAWAVPLVNIGVTLGGFYLGQGNLLSAVMNTAVVSGGATVVHDVVKNAVKGDKLQDSSVVVGAGQAATKYN